MTADPFRSKLRAELVAAGHTAAARRARRRRTVVAGLIAGLIAAAVPVVAGLLGPSPTSGPAAIARDDGVVTLRLPRDGQPVDIAALQAQLTAAGIDATVTTAEVDGPLVGLFVDAQLPGRDTAVEVTPTVVLLPADLDGPVTLVVGVPATAGATVGTNPFAAGGALACSPIVSMTPEQAHAALVDRGYQPRWVDLDGDDPAPQPDPPGHGRLVDATLADGTLVITTSAAPDGPPAMAPDGC